jgi:hypothetical protein
MPSVILKSIEIREKQREREREREKGIQKTRERDLIFQGEELIELLLFCSFWYTRAIKKKANRGLTWMPMNFEYEVWKFTIKIIYFKLY